MGWRITTATIALAVALVTTGLAQDRAEEEEDNGFIVGLIQDQLSTEHRKIRLSGIEGLLSSAATVERITISDPEGIWLQIEDAEIEWSRSALFRGALEIQRLAAERIEIPRAPIPEEGLPEPEATPLKVPELPVSVTLDELEVGHIVLGEDLAGIAAELSVAGSTKIADGSIEAKLSIERLDDPGGEFSLDLSYSNASRDLKLALDAAEPQGGLVAGLIGLPGSPPMSLSVQADGPIDDLAANLDLSLDGDPLVTGLLTVKADDGAVVYALDLDGRLEAVVPPTLGPFFAGDSTIEATLRTLADGAIEVPDFRIASGGIRLQGFATTTPDRFLSALSLDGGLGRSDGARLALPAGADTTIQSADLTFQYEPTGTWSGQFTFDDLRAGDIWIGRTSIETSGTATDIFLPGQRRVEAVVTGAATGISSPDRRLRDALGKRIDLDIRSLWEEGKPFVLQQAQIEGALGNIELAGQIDAGVFDGKLQVETSDIAPLSRLAGRSLSGAVTFSADGTVSPLDGGFDVTLDGRAQDLSLGVEALDNMFAGQTRLAGGIVRTASGLTVREFDLRSDQIAVTADGTWSSDFTDIDLDITLPDLAAITPLAEGATTLGAGLTGGPGRMDVNLAMSLPEGRLRGREARNLEIGFTGTGPTLARLTGDLSGSGSYAGAPLDLSGRLRLSDHVNILESFELSLLGSQFRGTVGQGGDGLFAGNFAVTSRDIAPLAGLALIEARGNADMTVLLSRRGSTQRVEIAGRAADIELPGAALDSADIALTVEDALGIPLLDGSAEISGLEAGGFGISRATLNASTEDAATRFDLTGEMDNGTDLDIAGAVENLAPGIAVDLNRLVAANAAHRVELAAPTRLSASGGAISLEALDLRADEGRLSLSGTVADNLDLDLGLQSVPLEVSSLFVPDLGVSGTITGDLRISGTLDDPDIGADLTATGLGTAATVDLGLPLLDARLAAQGTRKRMEVDAGVEAGNDLAATLTGTMPLDPDTDGADLSLDIQRLSLALADRIAGNQGLRGTLAGTAKITGRLADPGVTFDISGNGLSAQALAEAGIPAQTLSAQGNYRSFVVILDQASLSGGGLGLRASGQIPVFADGLDLSVEGSLPLTLANVALARPGIQVAGTARLSGQVTGSLSSPSVGGIAELSGGSLVVPAVNLRLDNIDLALTGSGDRLTISRGRARVAAGGRVTLTGTVGLDPGMTSDLDLGLRNAVYTDGKVVTTRLSGDIALDGPILGAGRISGRVDVGRTEITIPKSFGINAGVLLDIRHRNAPRDVRLTLDRAEVDEARESESRGNTGPALVTDIAIDAPNQIFVRGRGLDAELGGRLRLGGTTSELVPVGSLELIRGRLGILGQRFDFDEGAVTLIGTFDPRIRLIAETDVGEDTTVTITVEGRASDPDIRFTSNPDLPQDEVLALLIFSRNVSELSALQLAQLASAAATLAGSGGPGVAESLRSATGLANFDVTTDEDGGVGVRAGAYINDRIYLDVEAGSAGTTKATINLDISDSLRARTSVDSDGESSIGLFWERDY